MQAIITYYYGPTNTKGSRIKASCMGGSIVYSWDSEMDTEANHHEAALKLARKMGWGYQMVTGCIPSGDYVHVFTDLR